MRRIVLLALCLMGLSAAAEENTIDISGDNTDKNYISYSKTISLTESDVVNVKMARYAYFSSTIKGSGTLNLYAGGERCYLGTTGGKTWPNWANYTGNIHIYPFPENSASAGFYGVVLAFGGKTSSPESVYEDYEAGKAYGLDTLVLIDDKGVQMPGAGKYAGMFYADSEEAIALDLSRKLYNRRWGYSYGSVNDDIERTLKWLQNHIDPLNSNIQLIDVSSPDMGIQSHPINSGSYQYYSLEGTKLGSINMPGIMIQKASDGQKTRKIIVR